MIDWGTLSEREIIELLGRDRTAWESCPYPYYLAETSVRNRARDRACAYESARACAGTLKENWFPGALALASGEEIPQPAAIDICGSLDLRIRSALLASSDGSLPRAGWALTAIRETLAGSYITAIRAAHFCMRGSDTIREIVLRRYVWESRDG